MVHELFCFSSFALLAERLVYAILFWNKAGRLGACAWCFAIIYASIWFIRSSIVSVCNTESWDSSLTGFGGTHKWFGYLKMCQRNYYYSMVCRFWGLHSSLFLRYLGIIKSGSPGSMEHNQGVLYDDTKLELQGYEK